MPADRQTDRHIDTLITISAYLLEAK